uniref:Uncharacterized protein n=1 Tax=Nelumbo nucifera TaxID=4432 RepID=A0A822Y820_NELNU|nr:TPA_asm: hypothetical protein HUJ06_029189 [Nelumbo nucifera]
MLGWMNKSVNPSNNGVTGKECNPVSTKTPYLLIRILDTHSRLSKNRSLDLASFLLCQRFVEQALTMSSNLSDTVMKGFKLESIPIYASLVPTQPSMLFVYSATSHGSTSHKTIFDSLHENGLDFVIYFQNTPTTLFYRNLGKLKYIFNFHQFDLKFKKHAREGKLPSLTVIEPRYFDLKGLPANGDHPSHDVYETLRSSPQWNQTLLVITYEEHNGFFDHVNNRLNRVGREK